MISAAFHVLTCKRGSTLVGYSSLALLVAIAAITLLGRGNSETGATPYHRDHRIGTVSSD